MIKRFNSGFTFIEVLVAIAIIVVLASVILTSVSRARGKGKDTSLIENMRQFQGTAMLIYQDNKAFQKDNAGTLVDVCSWPTSLDPKPSQMLAQIAQLVSGSSSVFPGNGVACNVSSSGLQFILSAPKKLGNYICVDGENSLEDLTSTQASALSYQLEADGPGFTCNPND